MIYRTIGLMSGSSLDGLDIIFTELEESGGNWKFGIKAADCYKYSNEWRQRLTDAGKLDVRSYFQLHTAFGKFTAECVNDFIEKNSLFHQVQLISSHGHTVLHEPHEGFTTQLGCGATLAALTGINVVSDLRIMDIALGGQGAPIVPAGERVLFPGYEFYLNIGGIANLSFHTKDEIFAFDVCPANRILNMLANTKGKDFDNKGEIAASGKIIPELLNSLNEQLYYKLPYPKSLSNYFGTDVIYPLILSYEAETEDALRSYVEHIALQLYLSILSVRNADLKTNNPDKMLVTGGGAYNDFLVEKISGFLIDENIEVIVPENNVIEYKEALIMCLLGVLRWREENTVLASVTGASRSSIGGAVWIGQEA